MSARKTVRSEGMNTCSSASVSIVVREPVQDNGGLQQLPEVRLVELAEGG
jgi:hypothetical protein